MLKHFLSFALGIIVLIVVLDFFADRAIQKEAQEVMVTPLSWGQTAEIKTLGWVKGDARKREIRYKMHNRLDNVLDMTSLNLN